MLNTKQIRICFWLEQPNVIDIYVIDMDKPYVRFEDDSVFLLKKDYPYTQNEDYSNNGRQFRRNIHLSDLENKKILLCLKIYLNRYYYNDFKF